VRYRRKKFTFAVSSADEFLSFMLVARQLQRRTWFSQCQTWDVSKN